MGGGGCYFARNGGIKISTGSVINGIMMEETSEEIKS